MYWGSFWERVFLKTLGEASAESTPCCTTSICSAKFDQSGQMPKLSKTRLTNHSHAPNKHAINKPSMSSITHIDSQFSGVLGSDHSLRARGQFHDVLSDDEVRRTFTECFTECFMYTICFTICLFVSPDLDGYRAPKMKHRPCRDPERVCDDNEL
jgi:hypothetical protein